VGLKTDNSVGRLETRKSQNSSKCPGDSAECLTKFVGKKGSLLNFEDVS